MLPVGFESVIQMFDGSYKTKIAMEVLVILTSHFSISLFRDEPHRNKDARLAKRNSFPSENRQFASHFWGQRRYEDVVLRELSFSVTRVTPLL